MGQRLDICDADEQVDALRHVAETVRKLVLHLLHVLRAGNRSDALVHVQLLNLVADVGRGNIRVQLRIDLRLKILPLGLVTLHGADGFVEHLAIQIVSDAGNLAVLLRTEEISRAADLQVAKRNLVAGAELGVIADGL